MRREWDDFRAALAFLTILPVAGSLNLDEQRLVRSMGLFPAVGLILGLGLVIANALLSLWLPQPVVDGLLLLLLIWASGALHLDGVADLVDGLAGGRDRESILRIMKDSRVGAIGAVALVMLLLLKYQSLAAVPLGQKNAALLLMPTAGRWCQVWLARTANYLRGNEGTGAIFVDNVGSRELLVASLTLVPVALLLFSWRGLLLVLLLWLFAVLLRRYFERRLGGVTGDVLGAATELSELVALLLILAIH